MCEYNAISITNDSIIALRTYLDNFGVEWAFAKVDDTFGGAINSTLSHFIGTNGMKGHVLIKEYSVRFTNGTIYNGSSGRQVLQPCR